MAPARFPVFFRRTDLETCTDDHNGRLIHLSRMVGYSLIPISCQARIDVHLGFRGAADSLHLELSYAIIIAMCNEMTCESKCIIKPASPRTSFLDNEG